MWKVKKHKCGSGYQELKVAVLVNKMAEYDYLTYAESFIYRFHENLKEMPRSGNSFAAYMYRAKEISTYCVEVWKMTVEGDFKYKMFTLDLIPSS